MFILFLGVTLLHTSHKLEEAMATYGRPAVSYAVKTKFLSRLEHSLTNPTH
jgi:hypothetical protein